MVKLAGRDHRIHRQQSLEIPCSVNAIQLLAGGEYLAVGLPVRRLLQYRFRWESCEGFSELRKLLFTSRYASGLSVLDFIAAISALFIRPRIERGGKPPTDSRPRDHGLSPRPTIRAASLEADSVILRSSPVFGYTNLLIISQNKRPSLARLPLFKRITRKLWTSMFSGLRSA